jgi:hypothetical protein
MMRSVVLDPPLQRETREAIATCGERGVADACNLSSQSLFRAAVGSPVSRGTVALIERGLERVRQRLAGASPNGEGPTSGVGATGPDEMDRSEANTANASSRTKQRRSRTR